MSTANCDTALACICIYLNNILLQWSSPFSQLGKWYIGYVKFLASSRMCRNVNACQVYQAVPDVRILII